MKDTSFKASGAKRKKAGGAKRGITPFFAFLAEFRPQFLEKHPELKGVKEVSKAAGEKWRSMSDEEKAKYGSTKKQGDKASKKSTSSKKAKTDGREGEEAVKSEVEDDDEQDGNEDENE
ncbi:hypothetical protein BDA96_06G196600 [Sorghum bicolor]|uniref:HMG box domain-containing protein n=2 Tax=Sorghum bicolor TaxID=4558 RepID=A0A1B6PMM8_SORBI|nr:HMG1/2-like protein isoform X2 [Sorghum bicolor]KAG0527020.1 hypothetical protein BDA96_06G196600 [Sorghum bicolor]KXG26905.1 hypothetical protein SORBI_3006G179800 [Sorghum bicolor]|eukprot:XP_021319095.1 HMG1/2-like protein isoform X2 [Sorghum bicolor]